MLSRPIQILSDSQNVFKLFHNLATEAAGEVKRYSDQELELKLDTISAFLEEGPPYDNWSEWMNYDRHVRDELMDVIFQGAGLLRYDGKRMERYCIPELTKLYREIEILDNKISDWDNWPPGKESLQEFFHEIAAGIKLFRKSSMSPYIETSVKPDISNAQYKIG